MAETPRDYNQWVKSVERRLKQALRNGQSPQAVRLARDVQQVREEVNNIEAGSSPVPAAPIELVTQTRVLPDFQGINWGEVSVDFPDVVRDVNANPIEVDRYELWVNDLKEVEEPEEPDDDSWRTNLVANPAPTYWRSSATPNSKMVADLEEGKHFVVGDRLRFTVTMDMFGRFPHEDDELFHSVRLAAYQGDVEAPTWLVQTLPRGMEWDENAPRKEEFTVEGEVPEGTTRVTAHFGGTVLSGHIEFNSPTLFNMSEEFPIPPWVQRWKLVSTAVESSVAYSPLQIGADYDVRVRAVASGVPGPFSVTKRVTVERDRTPPPIPSPLSLTSSGATVTASWDLLAGTGDPMPGDFSNTEVAYGYHPAPTEVVGSITNLFSQAIFETPQPGTDVDFDGTYYFRHRAMDTSGNRSGWSESSSIVPKQLVDTAALQFELDAMNRERIEPLEQDIANAVSEATEDIRDFENRWDAQWDDTIPALAARQDVLEGEIVTGLDDVWQDAQDYAEAQASNAVNQAAANAQSEYDRLQELAERALSRAGDNVLEDPSFETDYWFNNWPSSWFPASPSALARTGDQALSLIRADGGGTATNATFDTIDVETDDTWRFSIWYRTVDDDEPNLGYNTGTRLRIRDGSNNVLAASTTLEPGEEYSRAVVTYTVEEGVTSLRPTLLMSFTQGTLIIDDIAFQEVGAAAEALRLAEVARQQAEAAHTAAGNAVDTAASAYDAVSSKSTVHWSLSAPSGTADNSDDVWWRYEVRNGRRTVIGQWFWDNGAWRETEIAEEWLPQVNIGTGTYGDLHGDRLTAGSVKTNHLLVGPRNIIADQDFETFSDDDYRTWRDNTGAWEIVELDWSQRPMVRLKTDEVESGNRHVTYGGNGPANCVLPCVPGETFKLRFQVVAYYGWSSSDDYIVQFRWASADGTGVAWTQEDWGGVGNRGWFEMEATAPEGAEKFYVRWRKLGEAQASRGFGTVSLRSMTTGEMTVDGTLLARHVDMQDFTADAGFIDNAFVHLIQGKMANFDEALIGGNLLKDRSIATRHLTIADTTDFAPDPVDYAAAWSLTRARVVSNTSSFEGAAIALDNTSTRDSQARGPILPVHPGDEIYVGAQIGYQGGAPTSGVVRLRMEWFEDATSSRETFTNVVSTTEASGWIEGTTTVPDYATHARFYIYTPSNSDSPGVRRIRSTKVRVQTGGELIVDGSIKTRNLDVEEIFFDSAVGNAIAVGAGEFITVETGNLAANAVTADKISFGSLNGALITGLQIQTHTNNRGVKLTNSGIRAFNSSGTETFTVNASNGDVSTLGGTFTAGTFQTHSSSNRGVKLTPAGLRGWDNYGVLSTRIGGDDNYLRGSLFAGPDESHGVDIHYSNTEVLVGWDDYDEPAEAIQQSVVPRLTFHTHHNHAVNPKIWIDRDDGVMNLNPGRLSGSYANSGELRIWGRTHANRLTTRRLDVPSTSSLQPGGLRRSGPNTSLRGRSVRGTDNAYEMFVTGQSPTVNTNNGNWRGSITWSYPPRNGMRRAVISGNLSETAVNNWRTLTTAIGGSTTTSYRWSHRQSHGEGGNQSHYYNAVWF